MNSLRTPGLLAVAAAFAGLGIVPVLAQTPESDDNRVSRAC